VPASLSGLSSLKTLDLRGNPKLKKIPRELCALRCLETLLLDEGSITYPAPGLAAQGTEAVMRFLCQGGSRGNGNLDPGVRGIPLDSPGL
jgi:hypothetical protein